MEKSFKTIISELGALLEGQVRTPIIVGGWAVNQLGFVRNTIDFDIMIFEEDFPLYEVSLNKIKYQKMARTSLFARFSPGNDSQLPIIDLLFSNKQTYEKMFAEGSMVELFGVEFLLPKVEHIIAMKLHAVLHGEAHRLGKDFEDIVSLIEIYDLDFSVDSEFYSLCEKYANDQIYTRIVDAIAK